MAVEFWQTLGGKKFFEGDVPAFLKELKKLNENLSALAPRKVRVWVVEYVHRHGNDIWVEGSEERAWNSIRVVLNENLSEVDDETQEKVKKLLAEGDLKLAIHTYCIANTEHFTVMDREVELERVS